MNTLFSAILFSALSWEEIYPNLMKSLNILWQGVLAILIVVGIIVAVTYLMQRASEKVKSKKQNDNGADESDKQ
ncbi:MAG TPA: hypothetical protein DIV38_00910 [Clostridiales bacterium]|nr:hypothetical protein [Clostridiales bacterium]